MNRAKKTCALILTALVIALCALLPQIAAALWDGEQKPGYAPLESVEFTLRGSGSILSRMAVLCQADRYLAISEELTNHTIDEIILLAEEALKPYQEAGMIQAPDLDLPSQVYSYEPYIVVAERENGTHSAVFWNLRILFDEEEPPLLLSLEDDTGKLVSITYANSKVNWFDAYESLPELVELYFTGLGETVPQTDARTMRNRHEEGRITEQVWPYYWSDPAVGDCGIQFYLYEYGFDITNIVGEVEVYE